MGIERFFNSLAKTETIKENGIILGLKEKIESNYVYIDFNSIIYNIVSNIEKELNYLLYSIILFEDDSNQLDEKSKSISESWKFSGNTVEEYKKYFVTNKIDTESINRIKNQIIYITTQLILPDGINLLHISIDGVPQMGKIIEQKKRRYNGYIMSKLKEKIFNLHFQNLSPNRQKYEMNKITYDRSKIISWATFMTDLLNVLSSVQFKKEIKQHNPNLNELIISHQGVNGEGEKKIMEHIIQNKRHGNYVIYSPDADAIILGMIATTLLNNDSKFNILRFNMQTDEYDCVNIHMLCENIYSYVVNNCNIKKSKKNNIINDIVFIFTLFGNDFLPKLESIDVRNDIETLMNIYCKSIDSLKKKHLIYIDKHGIFKINYNSFFNVIYEMSKIEDTLLFDTFMGNKYKNYGYYKRELGVERLYPALVEYIPSINNIFEKIRSDNHDNIITEYENNIVFMKQFLILECNYKRNNLDDKTVDEIIQIFKNEIHKLIRISKQKKSVGKYIHGKIKLQPYDSHDITSNYHVKNISELLTVIHPDLEVTDYDRDIYKLERRIGEYETKLNATDHKLGNIDINTTTTGNYKFVPYNMLSNIINYYDTFFDVGYVKEKINKDGTEKEIVIFDKKINDVVGEYIKGLLWVFDWYFNKNNSKYNEKNISTWFYAYHRAPLLYQIKDTLFEFKKNGAPQYFKRMDELYDNISIDKKNIVPRNKFMNSLEHYLYVTPKNKFLNVPKKYDDIISQNNLFFADLDLIVTQIWNGENISNIIDCRRIPYLNKCNLIGVQTVQFNDFMELMIPLRNENDTLKTKQSRDIKIIFNKTKRKKYLVDDKTKDTDDNIDTKTGGFHNKFSNNYYKNYFKHLYLLTGDQKFKEYYKKFKELKNDVLPPDNNDVDYSKS